MGKSVSSEDSSDAIAGNDDEASLTSSVVATRANSLSRRTKNSPINSLYLLSNHVSFSILFSVQHFELVATVPKMQ